MATKEKQLLIEVTEPFSRSDEHVQGPGGNTSVKLDSQLVIKASGYTFKDIVQGTGVVSVNLEAVLKSLTGRVNSNPQDIESRLPEVFWSVPPGLKPSMEFEFHAILEKFVVHTHSVYLNVITCSSRCEALLEEIFRPDEYLLVPYVTPGYPIAAYLLREKPEGVFPGVIFLKNHGLIIHGKDGSAVIRKYQEVEGRIRKHLSLSGQILLTPETKGETWAAISKQDIERLQIGLETLRSILTHEVLIPDQSIFFNGKVSDDASLTNRLSIDMQAGTLVFNGSQSFIAAGIAMINAVFYIRNNLDRLGYTADFLSDKEISILHNLSTEKYRSSLLN